MRPLRYVAETARIALQDLFRRPMPTVLSIAAMTVAIAVLGGFLIVARQASALLDVWSERATVEAFLHDEASGASAAAVERTAWGSGIAAEVAHVDAGRALEEFRKLYPELDDVDALLGENPFPPSIRITTETTDGNAIEVLVADLRALPEVSGVRYDQEWIDALGRFGEALAWFAAAGTLVCLFAALVTIGSVVRLALDDKRAEIKLLRLTGAPALFVVAPILVAGCVLGLAGGACALAALRAGGVLVAGTPVEGLFVGWQGGNVSLALPPSIQLALLALAAATGTCAAGLAGARDAFR